MTQQNLRKPCMVYTSCLVHYLSKGYTGQWHLVQMQQHPGRPSESGGMEGLRLRQRKPVASMVCCNQGMQELHVDL